MIEDLIARGAFYSIANVADNQSLTTDYLPLIISTGNNTLIQLLYNNSYNRVIHLACQYDQILLVKLYLILSEYTVSVNEYTLEDHLLMAFKSRSYKCIEFLIQYLNDPVLLNILIRRSIIEGDITIVDYLVEYDYRFTVEHFLISLRSNCPRVIATVYNNINRVDTLVYHSLLICIRSNRDMLPLVCNLLGPIPVAYQMPVIMEAIELDDDQSMRVLLEHGLTVDVHHCILAISTGKLECYKVMVKYL